MSEHGATPSPADKEQIGRLLVQVGLVSPEQLRLALEEQERTQERLGDILIRQGILGESDLLPVLAKQLGLRSFDLARDAVEVEALELVPIEVARRHRALPVRVADGVLTVAVHDPTDLVAIDHLRSVTGRELELLVAGSEVLLSSIERQYGRVKGSRTVKEAMDRAVVELKTAENGEDDPDEREATLLAQDAPIVRLVEEIIGQALLERATDIHIEPQETSLVVRYRVDGLLYTALTPPRAVFTGLATRVKILAKLDVAERRRSQDGRFTVRSGGREVDVRVSVIPTVYGEKFVLRLLDKDKFHFTLRDLGFSERDYQQLREAIHLPHGMILLSGPTGSGKSTTLYASLLEIRNETVNITTVEDPVEYQISRVNQVQVNPRKDVTFATALRSFLRQDPDVIMVGEIRDGETAEMAVRAALTGHLVFSTIHANDAPSTVTRLLSMGPEPFQVASALTLVAAQRLVRTICPHCKEEYTPPESLRMAVADLPMGGRGPTDGRPHRGAPSLAGPERDLHTSGPTDGRPHRGTPSGPDPGLDAPDLGAAGGRFYRGAGCAECKQRGYLGRIAIVELMRVTTTIRELVARAASAEEIRRAALAEGMYTLRRSGVEMVREGVTTLEEVLRVCLSDS